jgi:transcriptional regulator with XRE-family HTH domain
MCQTKVAGIRIMKNRLIEERKRLELNQEKMAELGGVAKRTYCDYEAGVSEPKASFLAAIAAAGADVQYILTGTRLAKLNNMMVILREVTQRVNDLPLDESSKSELQQLLFGLETANADLVANARTRLQTSDIEQYLTSRESALLDNYKHTDDFGKSIIEAAAFAAAEQKKQAKNGK